MAAPPEQFGPYLVYEQLGIGGMASVHRAEMTGALGFARSIALKRMLPHVAANDDMVKSFVREARLASHLHHANVAQTYELGRVGDIYFIAMELVVGRNLREILKHVAQQKLGPMPVPIALCIMNQLCEALDYAHNLCDDSGTPLGIIHRDVTPSNIIVSDGGAVKLIDFGIAKASAAGMQTMSGTLKGKFGYMAPEYIAGSLDARADLFALGVIAHELLTNRPLFTGQDDLETLTRVQKMEIQPPSKKNPVVPREIDDIVMTGLARDPERRWQHATALRSALGTLTKRLGLVATNTQVVEWVASIYDRTKPAFEFRMAERNDEEPSMVISTDEPSTDVGTAQLSASQRFAIVTPLIGRAMPHPSPAMPVPDHTPAKSITAQRSIPPTNTASNAAMTLPLMMAPSPDQTLPIPQQHGDPRSTLYGHQSGSQAVVSPPRSMPPAAAPQAAEYQAAVARYERHSGISPSAGMNIADVLPALRQSNPQIAIPRTQTPQQPPIAIPRTQTPSQQPPTIAIPRTQTPSQQPPTVAIAQHSGQIKLPPQAKTLFDPNASPPAPTSVPISSVSAMQKPAHAVALAIGSREPSAIDDAAITAPRAPQIPAPLPVSTIPADKKTNWVLAIVMVLVVAAAAGAVVYFVLPRLTS